MGIHPECKVLIALKSMAHGCAPSAFLAYFQTGQTTARDCLKKAAKIISHSHLREEYLRSMTKADAMRVSAMHEQEFGVAGCLGCLDCMHVFWRCCPMAWQGQYKGKEKHPSLVLEGLADYSCWLWHAKFGYPGSLNDINIWDQSALLKDILQGLYTTYLDFPFTVAGTQFMRLWFFVDGIYPELTRFVKTITIPIRPLQKKFSAWQESSQKAVERAFRILQRKFQFLQRPVELWFQEDIKDIAEACIILHNMMVEVRLSRDQIENDE